MSLLERGSRIGDRLVVEVCLGEGAYAEVYRVRHVHLGWQALKLFKLVTSVEQANAILGEAQLLTRLEHPNIVRVFDAGTIETAAGLRAYFTMEYVPGGDLTAMRSNYGHTGVPVDKAVSVIEQIAAGLGAAHQQSPPILHRDLTFANVLVADDENGLRVRLSDFGLSKRTDPVTYMASAQGTFAFMAPEVQRGEGCTCASDVFSLGTIAYLLLTDHFPYHDGNPYESFSMARFRHSARPVRDYNDDVDEHLDRIVLAALERDPAQRPRDALALAEKLRERRLAIARRSDQPAGLTEPRLPGQVPDPPVRPRPGTPDDLSGRSGPPQPQAAATEAAMSEHDSGSQAWQLAERAVALATDPRRLPEAAGLMDEAVSRSAAVRRRYAYRLELWRRGVMM